MAQGGPAFEAYRFSTPAIPAHRPFASGPSRPSAESARWTERTPGCINVAAPAANARAPPGDGRKGLHATLWAAAIVPPLGSVACRSKASHKLRGRRRRRRRSPRARFHAGALAGRADTPELAGGRCAVAATSASASSSSVSTMARSAARPPSSDRRENLGGYDAQKVEQLALQDPAAVVVRTGQVILGLGAYYASVRFDDWRGHVGPDAVMKQSRALRELLINLGPCYVKLGQALSNRPDLVRDDYMAELEKLQDNVPPFPSAEAMEILQQELGRDVREVFSQLSPKPVAAASFGQVYKGRLRSTGEEVAVKIQRPDLKTALVKDVYIFRTLASFADDWAREKLGCSMSLVVDEFGAKLWEESDYRLEAKNAQEFAANFAEDPTVKIMGVHPELTTRRVITMEWIDGVKCTDLQGLRRIGCEPGIFIRNGVQAALRQLLEFGLFHGDLHAGNIFALKDNRIAYVDFGNVAYIPAPQRDILVRALTHVANKDYDGIADDFVRLGMLPRGADTSELVPAMEVVWRDSFGQRVKDFTFRKVTAGFSRLVYRFPIRIPERFSLVFRALLMQEGICLCLDPEFGIIEVALPYASRRLLSDPDPSMRRELTNVIFKEENGRRVLQWDRLKNLVKMAKGFQDGTSIQFDEVIVNFFRGLRRDLLAAVAGERAAANEGRSTSPSVAPKKTVLPALPELPWVFGEGFANASGRARQAIRDGLEALTEGGRLQLAEVQEAVQEVVQLLGPDVLRPELARKVADALVQDSVQDLLTERGVELDAVPPGPQGLKQVLPLFLPVPGS